MNLKKKIVALGMVCALAVSMATSAFAVEVSTRGGSWGSPSHLYSYSAPSMTSPGSTYLNLEGNGSAYNHRPVTRAARTSSNDQMWSFVNFDLDNTQKCVSNQTDSSGNRTYALNLLRSTDSDGKYKCDIYRITSSDPNTKDSSVATVGDSSSFHIVLTGYGYALTPDENSRTMYWQTADYGVGSKQYWNKEYS